MGMTILQVVATFSLIWAAAVAYVIGEIRQVRYSKIERLENQDSGSVSRLSRWQLFLTASGVISGGLILSIIILTVVVALHQLVGYGVRMALYLLVGVTVGAAMFAGFHIRGMIMDLERYGIKEAKEMRWDVDRAVIVIVGMALFAMLSLLQIFDGVFF
jgi:glucan phosphoethanolaminetransferase (alkaline phosphatase superfamily)